MPVTLRENDKDNASRGRRAKKKNGSTTFPPSSAVSHDKATHMDQCLRKGNGDGQTKYFRPMIYKHWIVSVHYECSSAVQCLTYLTNKESNVQRSVKQNRSSFDFVFLTPQL